MNLIPSCTSLSLNHNHHHHHHRNPTHTTRPLVTVTLIFLLLLLVLCTTAHAHTYEEDHDSSSSWSEDDDGDNYQHDDGHYQQYQQQYQQQRRSWRQRQHQFEMLPGFKDWDNEPIVTALDEYLSAMGFLFQAVVRAVLILYHRTIIIFTLPYDCFVLPILTLFRLYSNNNYNKKSTALVLITPTSSFPDDLQLLYDTWTGVPSRMQCVQQTVLYAITFIIAGTLIATGVQRLAANAQVRNFMSRRGHGFVLVSVMIMLIDVGFILAETAVAVFQLANSAVVLTLYITVWLAVPAGVCVMIAAIVVITAWVFRDWTKDKR